MAKDTLMLAAVELTRLCYSKNLPRHRAELLKMVALNYADLQTLVTHEGRITFGEENGDEVMKVDDTVNPVISV